MPVETFVAELAVEEFDEAILHGFPLLNEVQRDAVLIRPGIHSAADELWLIVDRNALGRFPFRQNAMQGPGYSLGG